MHTMQRRRNSKCIWEKSRKTSQRRRWHLMCTSKGGSITHLRKFHPGLSKLHSVKLHLFLGAPGWFSQSNFWHWISAFDLRVEDCLRFSLSFSYLLNPFSRSISLKKKKRYIYFYLAHEGFLGNGALNIWYILDICKGNILRRSRTPKFTCTN